MKKAIKAKTLSEFKSEFNPDAEVVHLRKRVKELEAAKENERAATGEALEIVHELREAISQSSPVKMAYVAGNTSKASCTHVLHLTDWHYGAVTKKDDVDGFGEFSPEIAEERIHALGQAIIKKTEAQRHGYNVPKLHVLGTADFISGGIHQELLVTNAFPEPVQAVRCGYALGAMLQMFAPHFETIVADIVTLDNHGRLTKKPQAAEGGLNNWCYVVAEIAKHYCGRQPNIEVKIHAKPSALVTEGPERYLCFHGHQVKAWAGIPYYGLDRRVALEAVKRMGLPETGFTKLVSGHLHHAINGMTWNLGGSLSGTDAFDHGCGRHALPHQTSWFVHPKHGEFDFTRWWL